MNINVYFTHVRYALEFLRKLEITPEQVKVDLMIRIIKLDPSNVEVVALAELALDCSKSYIICVHSA